MRRKVGGCGWLDVDFEEDLDRGWRQMKWMNGIGGLETRVRHIYIASAI